MWISLLFAVLNLSLHLEKVSGVSPSQALVGEALRDVDERMHTFRILTAQCLILGNYTDPTRYTVETLLLYFLAEYFHAGDTHGNWLLFGIVVRTAMQMRFHKDASHDSSISTFRGEMQRRIWLSITHLDHHTSSQRGLPRLIKEGMSDAQLPRILSDADLDEDMTILPPSREGDDIGTSPLSYLALKTTITSLYGIILDSAYSTNPMSYDEVMRIDKMLEDVHDKIPEVVKARSVEDLKIGSPDIRLRKFTFELLEVLIAQTIFDSRSTIAEIYSFDQSVH